MQTMFVPLMKADAAQRLVYGFIDETPDRVNEVMDYATAKPAFQAWSADFAKASGGKSLGNIRAQHDMKKAAGRLQELVFNDAMKRIEFVAHIVDDQEWAKVEAGVYTGFSPGGSYAKSWKDGAYRRYTPRVGELSIVDMPCIPSGTFTMVKADGAEEQVEFVLAKAYEPGNDATKDRAEAMAKAAPGTTYKDHVVQARADLIAVNADAALAKMVSEDGPAADDAHDVGSGDPVPTDKLAALDAALAKADATLLGDDAPVGPLAAYAAAMAGVMAKCDVDLAVTPPSPDAVLLIGADLAKSLAAVAAIRAAAEPVLAKGIYSIGDAVSSLQSFSWITQDAIFEASIEGDGSPLPQMAVDIVNAMKAFVIAMVEEEVCEMLCRAQAEAGPDVVLVIEGADGVMELAASILDLVKANEPLMAKAGARNSKADAKRVQGIHDAACDLGAGCPDGGAAEKVASLAADNERLAKAVDGALPRLEALTETIATMRTEHKDAMEKMAGEIDRLGGQPAATKIELAVAKSKEEDNGALAKADEPSPNSIEATRTLPAAERQHALERIAFNAARGIPIPV